MKPVVFELEALFELDDAYLWYEDKQVGLGGSLKQEVASRLAAISEYPEAFPLWEGEVRRTTLRRFPYSLYYVIDDQIVRVVAVLHAASDPESARRRFDS